MKHATHQGFSMFELIIVMAVLGILAVISLGALNSAKREALVRSETEKAAQWLREAQNRSTSSHLGYGWEVTCNGSSMVMSGYTLVPAQSNLAPQAFNFAPTITCQSAASIKFQKLTGSLPVSAQIAIKRGATAVRTIKVESTGVIKVESL